MTATPGFAHHRLALTITVLAALAGGLSACSAGREGALETVCVEPRPQVCTKHYLPVCGRRADGSLDTYGNACTACADAAVVGHFPGACR